jgi:hypothetical protein
MKHQFPARFGAVIVSLKALKATVAPEARDVEFASLGGGLKSCK